MNGSRRLTVQARVAATTAFALAIGVPVFAHDTWILPGKFRVPIGEVRLGMTSGMEFPKPETAVKPDRIARSGVRLAGSDEALRIGTAEDGALELTAPLRMAGVAVIWAQSLPRTIELKPDQIRHYFDEVGAPETFVRAWEAKGTPPVRESYVKLAKAYVRVGDDEAADASWREPVGLELELVPDSDPTRFHAGGRLPLRLLWKGQPLAGLAVAAVTTAGKPQMARSDAEGRVEFELGTPGPWLLRATRVVEVHGKANEWESQFTTMTFEAR